MLIGDFFPLLVQVQPKEFTEDAVRTMAASFEVYFARGERYAVLSVPRAGAVRPGAKQRKLLTDWVNSPRVMEHGRRLCVASANVSTNTFERGLLTALLWLWRPPFPLEMFGDVDSALSYALRKMEEGSIRPPLQADHLRRAVHERLRSLEQ